MPNRTLMVTLLLLSWTVPVAAQQRDAPPLPELVMELFLTGTVYAQAKGAVQLTAQLGSSADTPWAVAGEYGITDRLQVGAEWTSLDADDAALDLGVLYALLPGQAPVALSASLSAALAEGGTTWTPSLMAGRQWGRVQLQGSAALEVAGEQRTAGGALGVMLEQGRFTPTFEWSLQEGGDQFVAPGLFLHVRQALEVAVAALLPVAGGAGERSLRVMLSVEF